MLALRSALASSLVLLAVACGSADTEISGSLAAGGASGASGGTASATPGTEGGQCRPNGTCSSGLSCLSDLCVNPLSGAGGRSGAAGGMAGTSGRAGTGGTAAGAGGRAEPDASADGGGATGTGGVIGKDAATSGGATSSGGVSGSGGTASGGAPGTGGAAVTDAGAADSGTGCPGIADAGATIECSSAADCCASGRTCGQFVFGTPPRVYCGAPFPAGGPAGAACSGALSPNSQCRTGLCPSSFASCSEVCTQDADCGDSAFLCRGLTVNGTLFGFCARECTGDPSCRSGQECVLRNSTLGLDRLEKYCRPIPVGASAPGTATTDANTCDHGQTVIVGQAQYCTAPCDANTDCPAAVPKCQTFGFLTPVTSTTVQLGLCVKP